ncbi:MAG: sulfotransferase [Myxococcales bacterium]|nr:sulfotransferase [Myxococcales bacterium]
MLDALIGHVAAALALDPAQIEPDHAAVDHGLDSLLVIEVLDALEHDLGLRVYPREFYTQPSLRAMADYLLAELAAAAAPEVRPDRDQWTVREGPLAALIAAADPALAPVAPVERTGFVLSAPRSGSTLLRTMLQGHPALFAPPELWLLIADDMAARARHLGPLGLDDGYTLALREARGCSTEEAEAEVAAMVAAEAPVWEAYRRLAGPVGDRVVIDKTPLYSQFEYSLDRVARGFAPGPLIHLVRHPLAVMDSIVRTRIVRVVHGSVGDPWFVAEGIWTLSAERMAAFAAAHPDRPVTPLHYEALVTRPREALEALCDALGLPFDEAMLDPYGEGRMTGGLRDGSAPMGDLGFAARGRVDPALAEAWRGSSRRRRCTRGPAPPPTRSATRSPPAATGSPCPPRPPRSLPPPIHARSRSPSAASSSPRSPGAPDAPSCLRCTACSTTPASGPCSPSASPRAGSASSRLICAATAPRRPSAPTPITRSSTSSTTRRPARCARRARAGDRPLDGRRDRRDPRRRRRRGLAARARRAAAAHRRRRPCRARRLALPPARPRPPTRAA